MSVREFGKGVIYVAFPPHGGYGEFKAPEGLMEWLKENTNPEWGYVKGNLAGVFLEQEDAVVFRLRWL